MATITISTVGYSTLHPLSESGMVFTSIYILINLLIITFTISMATSYIFEGQLQKIYKSFKIKQKISAMEKHVIICGLGRNGSKALEELLLNKELCIVVESNKEVIDNKKLNFKEVIYVNNDATLDETLLEANIKNAKAIIITLPKDADNVFVTLTARQLNPKIEIIARASEETTEIKLRRAGADHVVMPDSIGGMHMANLIIKPDIIRFLDMFSGIGVNNLMLEEINYQDLKPNFKNYRIAEIKTHSPEEVIQIGFKNNNGEFKINPDPNLTLSQGDALIILGKKEYISQFKQNICI
jgi:voltage-gated potassium channel